MALVYQDAIYVFGGKDQYNINVPFVEKLDLLSPTKVAESRVPQDFIILNNYPNPFNNSTVVQFNTTGSHYFSLDIYTITGQFITNLFAGPASPGRYEFMWDGTDEYNRPVSSGIYISRLSTSQQSVSNKMILLR